MASRTKLVQNICGGISKSNLAKVGLGESINCFPEAQSIDAHSCTIVNRTVMGEVQAAQISGRCRGMYRVSRGYDNNPCLYAVYDQTLYLIRRDHVVQEVGHIDSYNTECHMTETGGYGSAHPHLIVTDGTSVYAVNTGLSIGDQVMDFKRIALPLRVNSKTEHINPTHCAYLYGYLVVNDAGTDAFYTSYQYPFEIQNSEPDSFYEERQNFINWWMTLTDEQKLQYKSGEIQDAMYLQYKEFIDGTADDNPEVNDLFRVGTVQFANYGFVTYSEWSPDNTTALCSNGSKLYTFGERSWQMFSYNDDVNLPFSSPDNAAGNIGIKAPNSLAALGMNVLWLGSSDIGENGIFMLSGTELKRVSTQDIERELTQIVNPENAYSSIWQEHQHVFYSITFEDSDKTFVYDISEDAWHYRASYDPMNRLKFWRYNHATFSYGKIYVGTQDAIAYMSETKYTEHDGRKILKLRRGCVLTNEDRPFFIDAIELVLNNGQTSLFNIQPELPREQNPRISVRWSWDGSTFTDYMDSYMGKIGNYEWVTRYWKLGFGRFFTLEVSTTEDVPLAIQNLKIDWCPSSMM